MREPLRKCDTHFSPLPSSFYFIVLSCWSEYYKWQRSRSSLGLVDALLCRISFIFCSLNSNWTQCMICIEEMWSVLRGSTGEERVQCYSGTCFDFFSIVLISLRLIFSSTYLPHFHGNVLFFYRGFLSKLPSCALRSFPYLLPPGWNWDTSSFSLTPRYTGRSERTRTWPRTPCSAWPSSHPCTGPSSPTRAPRCLTWRTWWRVCSAWSTGEWRFSS